MTTLRDYILDCRCPNCGLSMERKAPPERPWWSNVTPPVVLFDVVMALVCCITGHWDRAAFFMAMAVFLTVIDR